MKIDFSKLAEVEKGMSETTLSLNVLRTMVLNVLNHENTCFNLAPNNIKTSINTLIELGILILDTPKDKDNKTKIEQLNS